MSGRCARTKPYSTGGAGALGQTVDQGHGQRLHAKNGTNTPSPALGCWSGGCRVAPPSLSTLNSWRTAGPRRVPAARSGRRAPAAGRRRWPRLRRLVDVGDLPARGQPTGSAAPVAEVRCGHRSRPCRWPGPASYRGFAVALLQVQPQVVGPAAGSTNAGSRWPAAVEWSAAVSGAGGRVQDRPAPGRPVRGCAGNAALTGIDTNPRPRQGVCEPPQQRPGQAGEQGWWRGRPAGLCVADSSAPV